MVLLGVMVVGLVVSRVPSGGPTSLTGQRAPGGTAQVPVQGRRVPIVAGGSSGGGGTGVRLVIAGRWPIRVHFITPILSVSVAALSPRLLSCGYLKVVLGGT